MYEKKIMSLDDVKRVARAAESEAQKNEWNVVIAIVDDGGHLMYLQREKVQLGSIEVAITKAKVALTFRRPTKFWEDTVAEGRHGYLAMPGMLPIEGGVTFDMRRRYCRCDRSKWREIFGRWTYSNDGSTSFVEIKECQCKFFDCREL